MKIYVGHSSSFDYKQDLYQTLKNSELSADHELTFPHENTEELFNSREFLKEEADVMIAEVSNPSTGLGIELGWADSLNVKLILLAQKNCSVSGSLEALESEVLRYSDSEDLIEAITKLLG